MLPSLALLLLAAVAEAFPESAGQLESAKSPMHRRHFGKHRQNNVWKRSMGPAWSSAPKLVTSQFTTGVAAMQLTVVGNTHVLIIDKAENNPAKVKGTNPIDKGTTHPAWMVWLDFTTGKYTALDPQSNSFCAGGSWLSNGTMVSVGGNPRYNAATYYDSNGITGIRLFNNCGDSTCELYENPDTLRLASARWYPGTVRLSDGSVMILGGMTEGGFNNAQESDNPTIEFYPSKSINNGLPVYSKFLHSALLSNLFPIAHLLPGGTVFVAANERAMIYNWQTSKETLLKNTPGLRVTYPYTSASALLPLTIANKWTPTVLFCGGSSINENILPYKQSSQQATASMCISMTLTAAGMKKGWIKEQNLPEARVMGETVITPDGKVLILNGAKTGMAGYSNVHDPIGSSNADHPDYRGVIYDPLQPVGKRLSTAMPTSKIPRLYHSVATLLPSGEIMITGSNPNQDVSTQVYKTDYSIEFLTPPYITSNRISYTWKPDSILYGKSFKIILQNMPSGIVETDVSIVLIDVGYHTHGVGVDQRLLELTHSGWDQSTGQVLVRGPKDGTYMAPGYAWLFVCVSKAGSQSCSTGGKVMIGNGASPPFDVAAYNNMMAKTKSTHGSVIYRH